MKGVSKGRANRFYDHVEMNVTWKQYVDIENWGKVSRRREHNYFLVWDAFFNAVLGTFSEKNYNAFCSKNFTEFLYIF